MALDNGFVVGAVGLEVYEGNGLLRSLVVKPQYRKMKIAAALVSEVEKTAGKLGLQAIYLLTETAREYFGKRGFVVIERSAAPASIQVSSEFSSVCPASATLMQKPLI